MHAKAPPPRRAPAVTRGRVAQLIEDRQGSGKLIVTLSELVAISQLSALAVRRQVERLSPHVVLLPGRPTTYLTVPSEDRVRGAPPVAAWLHDYLVTREPRYYVGLLSAAALHDSAAQAPLVTQVLVPAVRRPIEVGRTRIVFITKRARSLEATPLTAIAGMPAPLNVSSPEATALDLITYSHRIGGLGRALEVIQGLKPRLSVDGLNRAAAAGIPITVLQRAGYLFETLGWGQLAHALERALPARFPATALQTGGRLANDKPDNRWAVVDNLHLLPSART